MTTSPQAADILAAVADAGGHATDPQIRAALGYRPDPAAIQKLQLRGSLTGGGQARAADRTPYRIADDGRRHLARLTNLAARFDPADPATAGPQPDASEQVDSYPSITTGGAQAFLYVDAAGALRLALHLDTGEVPGWLTRPDETIPVRVTVNGDTVFDDTGTPAAARAQAEYGVARLRPIRRITASWPPRRSAAHTYLARIHALMNGAEDWSDGPTLLTGVAEILTEAGYPFPADADPPAPAPGTPRAGTGR